MHRMRLFNVIVREVQWILLRLFERLTSFRQGIAATYREAWAFRCSFVSATSLHSTHLRNLSRVSQICKPTCVHCRSLCLDEPTCRCGPIHGGLNGARIPRELHATITRLWQLTKGVFGTLTMGEWFHHAVQIIRVGFFILVKTLQARSLVRPESVGWRFQRIALDFLTRHIFSQFVLKATDISEGGL